MVVVARNRITSVNNMINYMRAKAMQESRVIKFQDCEAL